MTSCNERQAQQIAVTRLSKMIYGAVGHCLTFLSRYQPGLGSNANAFAFENVAFVFVFLESKTFAFAFDSKHLHLNKNI